MRVTSIERLSHGQEQVEARDRLELELVRIGETTLGHGNVVVDLPVDDLPTVFGNLQADIAGPMFRMVRLDLNDSRRHCKWYRQRYFGLWVTN